MHPKQHTPVNIGMTRTTVRASVRLYRSLRTCPFPIPQSPYTYMRCVTVLRIRYAVYGISMWELWASVIAERKSELTEAISAITLREAIRVFSQSVVFLPVSFISLSLCLGPC